MNRRVREVWRLIPHNQSMAEGAQEPVSPLPGPLLCLTCIAQADTCHVPRCDALSRGLLCAPCPSCCLFGSHSPKPMPSSFINLFPQRKRVARLTIPYPELSVDSLPLQNKAQRLGLLSRLSRIGLSGVSRIFAHCSPHSPDAFSWGFSVPVVHYNHGGPRR